MLSHGWADPALNPLSTIEYYEQVQARDAGTRDYARLFMMPGVLHCGGGAGPDPWTVAPLSTGWNTARRRSASSRRSDSAEGRVLRSRPLCPYPQRAVYDGKGSVTEAESFVCRAR